jgi:hypothetical protein
MVRPLARSPRLAVLRRAWLAWLTFVLVPVMLGAQDTIETPEAVVRRYTEAMRGGEWDTAARLMHPEALAQFRQMMLPAFQAEGPGRSLRDQFFDGMTEARIRHLSDTAFFARFFRGMMALNPELLGVVQGAEIAMVGHVLEGEDVAHVVYRMQMQMDEMTFTKLDVMSVKRHGATWRGLLTGTMEGLVAALSGTRGGE